MGRHGGFDDGLVAAGHPNASTGHASACIVQHGAGAGHTGGSFWAAVSCPFHKLKIWGFGFRSREVGWVWLVGQSYHPTIRIMFPWHMQACFASPRLPHAPPNHLPKKAIVGANPRVQRLCAFALPLSALSRR